MSHAGPKRPERKAKPFAQAVPAAPLSLKVRKQQVVRAADGKLLVEGLVWAWRKGFLTWS